MRIGPCLSGRGKRSPFAAVVVVARAGAGLRLLDAEDVVAGHDGPPAVFELDNHLLGEDFQSNDPTLSATGDDSRADGREVALESTVGVKLVTETALQSTTAPRDFRGV